MYRPQFPWKTPDGFVDQDFSYSFDGSTVPLLAPSIPGGAFIQNIFMRLQPDEMFLWRGWKVQGYGPSLQPLYIWFKDSHGNYLSNAPIPSLHWTYPSGTIGFGFATVPLEPEIVCPAGSVVTLYIQNPGILTVTNPPRVILYGVKRGPEVPVV